MWKHNYCPDVVSPRDIMVLEMLEWYELTNAKHKIDNKLHDCNFTAAHFDAMKRHITMDELKRIYNNDQR